MQITALSQARIEEIVHLMSLGGPYIRARTPSDYWLYAKLFSSTCPIALVDGVVIGSVIAMRSQDDPAEVYIQDVMTHPDRRRNGVATALVDVVRQRAQQWACRRVYLTSDPNNAPACAVWTSLGFTNTAGDYIRDGVALTKDFKGPGQDRAVFEFLLS